MFIVYLLLKKYPIRK